MPTRLRQKLGGRSQHWKHYADATHISVRSTEPLLWIQVLQTVTIHTLEATMMSLTKSLTVGSTGGGGADEKRDNHKTEEKLL